MKNPPPDPALPPPNGNSAHPHPDRSHYPVHHRSSSQYLKPYPRLLPLSKLPPNLRHVVATFGVVSWLGFWSQVVMAGIATVSLFLALPARGVGAGVNVPGAGLSIVLTGIALLWLLASLGLEFLYTRIPWRLRLPDPLQRPSKAETVSVLHWGMWVDMVGAVVALVAAEVSVIVLLSKALSQPQGVAIYDPLRIIRPLDVLIVFANINILGSFLVGLLASLWLLHDLHQD